MAGFIKNSHGTVRSCWRILLLYVLFFAVTLILGIWFGIIGAFTHIGRLDNLLELAQELAEIGAVIIMVYFFEKSKLRRFGFPIHRKFGREILLGVGWGALSMIVIFCVFQGSGLASLKGSLLHPFWSIDLLWMLILMILVGFGEEMLTRGYTMTMLQRQSGKTWVSVGVSSVIFAALHLINPHVSVLGIINLVLYAIVAAFMYIRSGSLWMPIAYHATWDYFEGNVFGFPNSGNVMPSLYSFSHVTSNIITGGGFGPEGGIVVTVILLITLTWTLKGYKPKKQSDWMENSLI